MQLAGQSVDRFDWMGEIMAERVDELANNVDDALTSVDELDNDPGTVKEKSIEKVKKALNTAKDAVDDMEDAED